MPMLKRYINDISQRTNCADVVSYMRKKSSSVTANYKFFVIFALLNI